MFNKQIHNREIQHFVTNHKVFQVADVTYLQFRNNLNFYKQVGPSLPYVNDPRQILPSHFDRIFVEARGEIYTVLGFDARSQSISEPSLIVVRGGMPRLAGMKTVALDPEQVGFWWINTEADDAERLGLAEFVKFPNPHRLLS